MQQRLDELLQIPDQIQETLMNVAKTMQKFLPPGSLIVTDPVESVVEEVEQYDDSYRFDEVELAQEEPEGNQTDDDLDDGELEKDEEGAQGEEEEVPEPAVVEEEPEPEKPNPLSKWPWTQGRNTFKRSNFEGYRSNSLIQNR